MAPNKTQPDGLAHVLIEISRADIEADRLSRVLSCLYPLTDTREHLLAYRESVSLTISGYDIDSRDLSKIPDVRRFMERLSLEWPHWIWFLSRRDGGIPFLMSLLCGIKVVRDQACSGMYKVEFKSPRVLCTKLQNMIERSEWLLKDFDLDPTILLASRESAEKALDLT